MWVLILCPTNCDCRQVTRPLCFFMHKMGIMIIIFTSQGCEQRKKCLELCLAQSKHHINVYYFFNSRDNGRV